MGILNFIKRQKPENVVYRLVWFELQIAPATYRFAIMPEQPILIGYEGDNGDTIVLLINGEVSITQALTLKNSKTITKRI